jgi:hypothetical protein
MPNFQHIDLYPELMIVQQRFDILYADAIRCMNKMIPVRDKRVKNDNWKVLPLVLEEEDRNFINDLESKKLQDIVPATFSLLSQIPSIKAFAYSQLQPHSIIAAHKHSNPFVTASFCLSCEPASCYIKVNDEIRFFEEKELIIFDYTQMHEVVNNGNLARVVLLMLLENRCC